MRPTDPIELLACAIFTQEGTYNPATEGHQRNNPGDLRYAGQAGAHCPRCGAGNGHVPAKCVAEGVSRDWHDIASFVTWAMGRAALLRQLWLQAVEGQTVAQIIGQWAPPNENNTSVYLENVVKWTGLAAGQRPLDMQPPLVRLNQEAT